MDWFSNFSFAKKLGHSGSTDLVIKKIKKIFLRHGFCEQLRTDFGQSFQAWCRRAGIDLCHSSAYNSSGNSRAEKKIQNVKNLLWKCKDTGPDFSEAHSEWRNSPTVQGASSAQLFYKRHVRSGVLVEIYREIDSTQDAGSRRGQEQEARFKRGTSHAAPLLERDLEVRLQDKETKWWDIRAWVRHGRPHIYFTKMNGWLDNTSPDQRVQVLQV